MRQTARFSLICIASMLAVSALAQQRPQDFTLPEPTPSATPQPEGPVDDSGVIPVGPRVIPTATPTPVPTGTTPAPVATQTPTPTASPASPAPGTAPTRTSQPQPTATLQPRPSATNTAPAVQPTLNPLPTAEDSAPPASDAPATITTGSDPSLPTLPSETPDATQTGANAPPSGNDLPWLYIMLGIVAAAIATGGFLFWRRKAENAPPPKIKRPVVDAALDHVGSAAIPPRYDLSFEVEGVTRSLMAVMVTGRMVVKNRGERAIRDVKLLAELTSAHHPSAKTDGDLDEIGAIERIGPHQAQRHKLNLRLPLDQIAGMNREGVPVFVPLLRLEAVTDGGDPVRLDLVLGTTPPGVGHKLQPLRLDGPPGAYDHLRGHPLNA